MTEPADAAETATTPEIRPVLVATDFSEDSKAALLWACRFVEGTGAPLIILHVVHDLASHPGFYHPEGSQQLQPMQEVAESMMEKFLAPLRADRRDCKTLADADLQFIRGLPPTRIVEVAELLRADLIAIGSRGVTCLPHKLLGATAERVAELSTIPVVIVKSHQHGVLDKKAVKKLKKKVKKDRKHLKKILGVNREKEIKGSVDE